MTPSTSVFLSHYTVRVGKKVGWVPLAPLPNTSLFTAYTTSYKGFKGRFLKIKALSGAFFCSDSKSLPLYWRLPLKDQVAPKSQLPMEEKAALQLLDELPRGMNCKELVALVGEGDLKDYLRSMLKRKSLYMDELIRKSKQVSQAKGVSALREITRTKKELASSISEKKSAFPMAKKKLASPMVEKKLAALAAKGTSRVPAAEEVPAASVTGMPAPATETTSAPLLA
ncbi:hypothetical protein CR513_14528, partial [Mucuna pruriens]